MIKASDVHDADTPTGRKKPIFDGCIELHPPVMNYEKWIDPMGTDEFKALYKSSGMSLTELGARLGFNRNKLSIWCSGGEKIPLFAANYMRCWWKLWNIHNFSQPNPIKVYYRRSYPRNAEGEVLGYMDEDLKIPDLGLVKKAHYLRGLGYSLRDIAEACGCSHMTVKRYLDKADKLGLLRFENAIKEG